MYVQRLSRNIAIAHHNGPPGSKCHGNHGHTLKVLVEFRFRDEQLDEWGWGPDFIKIKKLIDGFDHKDLNDLFTDHPPSVENFAKGLYRLLEADTGFEPSFVEVWESPEASVRYSS